jgi:hypothetical protein
METPDWKAIIDAGGMGVLVLVLFMASKKIDRIHDTLDRLLAQLIEIIGRDMNERSVQKTRAYLKDKFPDDYKSDD